ncbi:MAG: hypothetical protein A2075_18915 [Geobacteraceae bacterium GWC2_58_44]|nr:MAG: hypothetical protein A2075_18915 [Geobacteraceae bacterium GWC2_58_44]HBG07880.1 hypothetical protein [Geobacter sp.]
MPYLPVKTKVMARILACILIFMATLEICARIDDTIVYEAPLFGRYDASSLRILEGDIPRNIPNSRFEKWRNNNLGFRGADFELRKPIGKTRVVCLGASETYGLYESSGKEWPAQMQELVPGNAFQVINASVVGLNLTKYDQYVRKHVLPLKPDVLVVSVNPFFYAVTQERAAKSNTSKAKHVTKKDDILSTDQIRVLPKLKQVVKQAAARTFPDALKRYQLVKMQEEIKHLETTRLKGKKPRDSVPEIYVEHFRAELEKFIEFAESHGVKVILLTYPSLISWRNLNQYPEIFLDSRRFSIEYSLTGMIDIQDRFNAIIRSSALSHRIGIVDMSAIVPKSTEFFGDNVHYTDRGARTIADHVAQEIVGNASSSSITGSLNKGDAR